LRKRCDRPIHEAALAVAAILLLFMCFCGCDRNRTPVSPQVDFSVTDDLTAQLSTWRLGKQAVVTLAFDDTRDCHHQIVAPALEERGFRGTFNLNTDRASQSWQPWIRLFERGHELGNHTRHHPRLTDLSLDEAREEIEGGREDLLAAIPGLSDVVSFTYPYAASNPEVCQIVMETHLSARGGGGINPCSPGDYSLLLGSSYGDLDEWRNRICSCVSEGGWMIHYFHEVGGEGVPVDQFEAYMDYLAARQDSLWLATQGEAAKYAMERDNCVVHLTGTNPGMLHLETPLDPVRFNIPLSICLTATCDEIDLLVVNGAICSLSERRQAWIEVAPGDTVVVEGKTLYE
jgi:peptidoglycan/xylan/chitin deacetylase (PgdA/CDA1 family)